MFRQKAPKPVTPRLASLERMDASLRRANQLAALRQGPPADESVPPWGQTAGVGPWETEHFSDSHERARSPIFCMIPKTIRNGKVVPALWEVEGEEEVGEMCRQFGVREQTY